MDHPLPHPRCFKLLLYLLLPTLLLHHRFSWLAGSLNFHNIPSVTCDPYPFRQTVNDLSPRLEYKTIIID